MGLQAPAALGWRPDHARSHHVNSAKCLPPAGTLGRIRIRLAAKIKWHPSGGELGRERADSVEGAPRSGDWAATLEVHVGVSFQRYIGATCSWMLLGAVPDSLDAAGSISTHGWVIGEGSGVGSVSDCPEMRGLW